ncbi:hypothetical protein ACTHTQ_05395 [Neisseria sp. P0020.S003]|nr:MAG TPA: hypothetical protein [Bacteriophage sp.]
MSIFAIIGIVFAAELAAWLYVEYKIEQKKLDAEIEERIQDYFNY